MKTADLIAGNQHMSTLVRVGFQPAAAARLARNIVEEEA